MLSKPDPLRADKLKAFDRLLTVMDELRENCPWDKKQTIASLRHLTIEETYELSDAILSEDMNEVKKELGDILLHIVFYARIASENNDFSITEVIHQLCDKLVERHPHIYGNIIAETEDEVKANWEKIKLKTGSKGVLSGVPKGLPALVKAMRIQEKARGAGFDWEDKDDVWKKVQEEIGEFELEYKNGADIERLEDEFGDVLFSLVNFARFVGINPETALERTNKKFIKRFNYLEQASIAAGKTLSEMSLAEMDVYWNEAKLLP
jgi:XTP/dITP diphosphohydrolase